MNKYEIIETVDEGQYGIVMKAKNKEDSSLVAIKKFKEDDSDDQIKKIILRQIRILKSMSHENVISLKEVFRKKGKIFLVCEYVERNLLRVIESGGLSRSQVRHYGYEMLKGIAYMHSLNIIHRDVKPQNVLVSQNDRIKLCDLGFARVQSTHQPMTQYVATRWYRPPQLLIGVRQYDQSIDVWSAACVLAEMIDGEPLFGGENDLDQLYLIQKCLGPLPAHQQEYFLKNPKFIGVNFPEIHNLEPIDRKYAGKIDKSGLDLLKKMLKIDPKMRISVEEALNHPYFNKCHGTTETETKRHKEKIKNQTHQDQHQIQDNGSQTRIIHQPKTNLPPNNFLFQKVPPKEDKMINIVRGFNRLKKNQVGFLTKEGQQLSKGKSLGHKKPNSIRDKNLLFQKHQQSRPTVKNSQKEKQIDQYYEEKWDEDQTTHKECSKETRTKIKKNHRENIHIVFNNNTYNVNLFDPNH